MKQENKPKYYDEIMNLLVKVFKEDWMPMDVSKEIFKNILFDKKMNVDSLSRSLEFGSNIGFSIENQLKAIEQIFKDMKEITGYDEMMKEMRTDIEKAFKIESIILKSKIDPQLN